MSSFTWTKLDRPRLTRKDRKRARRKEKCCRKIMVHYAGNALLCLSTDSQIRITTSQATGWSTRRPVKVPRRLRRFLGPTVGGPMTWAHAYRLNMDIAGIVAAYSSQPQVVT